MPRLPVIIWTSLGIELWRLIALSALVLVGIAVFGIAVRPLASGQVGPLGAMQLMALAAVPMLQFTVPFAAGFAATLAYHRFASDNEALAASAGGVSHGSLLAPAAISAVLLGVVIGVLTHMVIPRFFRAMDLIIQKDAARLIVQAVEQGESVEVQDLLVYADDVARLPTGSITGVDEALLLDGVVAINTNDRDEVNREIAAERVEVWLQPGRVENEQVTLVTMRLRNWVGKQRGDELIRSDQRVVQTQPIALPRAIPDKADFLPTGRLHELRETPDEYSEVARRRDDLASAMIVEVVGDAIRDAFENEGRLRLRDDEGRQLILRASGAERDGRRWRLLASGGDGRVALDWRLTDGRIRNQSAAEAWLTPEADPRSRRTLLTLELEDVATPEADNARRADLTRERLQLANDPAPAIFAVSSQGLLDDSRRFIDRTGREASGESIATLRERLIDRIAKFQREITSNIHERYALSAACFVMTLTGAVMALRLREALPLTVYTWSFFPALAAIVTISGGQKLAEDAVFMGLVVMWSGVALLLLYTLLIFLNLRKH